MPSSRYVIVITLLVIITLAGVLLAFGFDSSYYDRRVCYARTADMGYEARWDRWTGCMIEIESDRWIPLDAYYYQERP